MIIKARPYQPEDAAKWDELVGRSQNGTLLHTRRFLSHHGIRFRDTSLVLESEKGKLLGVLPAAVHPSDAEVVVSHPGLTYGGLVHCGGLAGPQMAQALEAMTDAFRTMGFRQLQYRAIPHMYHSRPSEDDEYFLMAMGARQESVQISAAIALDNRPKLSKGRTHALKKAARAGAEIVEGAEYLAPFWNILADNLWTKHGSQPTHTLAEVEALHELFPQEIVCRVARLDGEVLAGTLLFVTPRVVHTQYLSASPRGHELSALDLVIERSIDDALSLGRSFLNFGTSQAEDGLNSGLYHYKTSFGASGLLHRFLVIDLNG